jgi:hypothetical protein
MPFELIQYLLGDKSSSQIQLGDLDHYFWKPIDDYLTQYIINPLNTYVISSLADLGNFLYNTVSQGLNYLTNMINSVYNFLGSISNGLMGIYNGIINAFNSYIVAPIESFFLGAISFLSGIPSTLGQIWSFISGLGTVVGNSFYGLIVQPIESFFSGALSFLNGIPSELSQIWSIISGLGDYVISGVSGIVNIIVSGLSTISSDILNGLNNYVVAPIEAFFAGIASTVGDLGQTLANVGSFVVSGFNQLATGLNGFVSDFTGGIASLADAVWKALSDFVTSDVIPAIQTVWTDIRAVFVWIEQEAQGIYNSAMTLLRDGLLQVLPYSPDEALDSAFLALGLGVGATISGHVIGMSVDATHPLKKWGVQNLMQETLNVLGISAIAGSMYGIIVSCGWGAQLKYFFNYATQPMRLDENGSAQGVFYGVRTIDQYAEDLRYEGYNDDAINTKKATMFKPLPRLIMQTMFEEGLIDDASMQTEIMKTGYDPSQSQIITQAIENKKLVSYQDTVKSLVFSYFKDGFTDVNTAKQICAAFNIPQNQVQWILTLANYEFKYEQYQKLVVWIQNEFAKNIIDAEAAVNMLVALGMTIDRATVLIATKGLTQAPPPPASTRSQILQDALSLVVNVS